MDCPICHGGKLRLSIEKLQSNEVSLEKYICDNCGVIFQKTAGKFKLLETKNSVIPLQSFNGLILTYNQWEQVAKGWKVHYNLRSGKYTTYQPDEFSEFKPSHQAPLENNLEKKNKPPSGISSKAAAIPNKALDNSDEDNTFTLIPREHAGSPNEAIDNSDEDKEPLPENTDSSEYNDNLSENYYMPEAGKIFLKMQFQDILQTYHLLKCFDEGIELEPEEYDYLVKRGLLDEKQD